MEPYLTAAFAGIVAGMRSMSAPAQVSRRLSETRPEAVLQSPLSPLCSPITAKVLSSLAMGELAADKLPNIPNRIAPAPLAARGVSGSVCGAAVCLAGGRRADVGALIGGLAAIASTFAFYHLRRTLSEKAHIPDSVLAVCEDTLVATIGTRVLGV